jgi:hypothetical protein
VLILLLSPLQPIDMRWNVARAVKTGRRVDDADNETATSAFDDAFLVHFNGNFKPWSVEARRHTAYVELWRVWARGSNCTESQRRTCACDGARAASARIAAQRRHDTVWHVGGMLIGGENACTHAWCNDERMRTGLTFGGTLLYVWYAAARVPATKMN